MHMWKCEIDAKYKKTYRNKIYTHRFPDLFFNLNKTSSYWKKLSFYKEYKIIKIYKDFQIYNNQNLEREIIKIKTQLVVRKSFTTKCL